MYLITCKILINWKYVYIVSGLKERIFKIKIKGNEFFLFYWGCENE